MLAPSETLFAAKRVALSLALPFRRGAAAAGLPQRVKILGWGENIGRTTGARILVDDKVAQTLSSNQELVAIERVPMDYEHQSHKDHPNYLPDPRLSPGAGTIEVVPGEGVFLSAIEYTSNGATHAESYQDVSAVVHLDGEGRPLWISSVALTQTGDVSGMEFSEAVAVLSARTDLSKPPPNMETTDPFRPLLLKFLKLSDDATDEEIIAAAEKANSTTPETETMETPAETAALSARLDALEATLANTERAALIDRATREGKVIPLSAEHANATPVAVLAAMIEQLPVTVPLQATGTREAVATTTALSADEKGAAARLGLTEAEYLKGKQ